jgi:hypothetical protein
MFIEMLVGEYQAGRIKTWDDLDERVKTFFTPERLGKIEAKAPGWKKMASYSEGITLTHVTCVFLGLFMLPEFKSLSDEQKQLAKWIVLLHDIDKIHVRGKRDTMHAFRSGVVAANVLPNVGFPVDEEYGELIHSWSDFTVNAFTLEEEGSSPRPDNRKLSEILSGIDRLFGENTPASLIVKTVLLHISLDVDVNYPTPSPLTENQVRQLINPSLLSLLRVMMLSDNEGWSLFEPEVREQQRRDAAVAFEKVDKLIA